MGTSAAATRREAEAVLEHWFGPDIGDPEAFARHKARWFSGGPAFDRELAVRFGALHGRAAAGELDAWAAQARERLVLILLLDQLSRNLGRGTSAAFAGDARALALAETGIAAGLDAELAPIERVFFYMPYQHAESLAAQQRGVALFEALARAKCPAHQRDALSDFAAYAREHRDIVARFGRFPHRNRVLGRPSTPAEARYLDDGAPSFGQ